MGNASSKLSLVKTKEQACQKPRMSKLKLLMTILGLACMIFFRFIPPYSTITSVGWALIGDFIGCVLLWTFVDLVWPIFPIIVMFGFDAFALYPGSVQGAGIYEACMQSIGNFIPVFIIGCLVFCILLEDSGLMNRITYFFISRRFAQKSGWHFSVMLLASSLVVVLFLDVTPVQFFFYSLCEEIFLLFGFKKGDEWPKFIVTSMAYILLIGFVMTPICHAMSLLWMGIYSGITGSGNNILQFTMMAFPFGLLLVVLIVLYFRFVVKPDMSQFQNVDFSALDKMAPGPWTKKEIIVTVTLLITILGWLLPGVLDLVAPTWSVTLFLDSLTHVGILFIALTVLCIIHVDGKPVCDLNEIFPRVQWGTVMLLAGFSVIANAISADACGIGAFLGIVFTPFVENLGAWAFVAAVGAICVLLTNILNQIPVGVIFMSVAIPVCMVNGINPLIMAITICIASSMAFTIPPAALNISICYANPWSKGSYILKHGCVVMIISLLMVLVLCYPMGSALFGA